MNKHSIKFKFIKDYNTPSKRYLKGDVCNINGIFIIGKNGKCMFEFESFQAKEYGKFIKEYST